MIVLPRSGRDHLVAVAVAGIIVILAGLLGIYLATLLIMGVML